MEKDDIDHQDLDRENNPIEDVSDLYDEKSPLDFIEGSVVKMKTQCPECGKYLANVNEHIKLVHLKIRNHACSECPYRSCFKNDLEKHMQAVHGKSSYFIIGASKSVKENENTIDCKNVEDQEVVQERSSCLVGSCMNMEEGRTINPEIRSSHEPSFIEISKVHSETKTTQCPHCEKFLTNIKEHIKAVHMKEKNYFCKMCDYKTLFKSDLLKHDDLVHRKLKKTCQECGKQVANLPEHVRMVHRKEKNFKCSYCGYSCAKQSDMKKHSKNVHKVPV